MSLSSRFPVEVRSNGLRPETGIIVATHHSNIISKTLPAERIGQICAAEKIDYIVDASQSAGHIPVDMKKMNITSLCMPGHKGLFGPMGCGLLISRPGVVYKTLIEGGAGINSLDIEMPEFLPERLEAGTLPIPAIAGLNAGLSWVRSIGYNRIQTHERRLAEIFVSLVSKYSGVRFYGDTGAVLLLNIDNKSSAEVGEALSAENICTRAGYHCAPLAHRSIGTFERGGVRVSFSYMNTTRDVEMAAYAISKLCK